MILAAPTESLVVRLRADTGDILGVDRLTTPFEKAHSGADGNPILCLQADSGSKSGPIGHTLTAKGNLSPPLSLSSHTITAHFQLTSPDAPKASPQCSWNPATRQFLVYASTPSNVRCVRLSHFTSNSTIVGAQLDPIDDRLLLTDSLSQSTYIFARAPFLEFALLGSTRPHAVASRSAPTPSTAKKPFDEVLMAVRSASSYGSCTNALSPLPFDLPPEKGNAVIHAGASSTHAAKAILQRFWSNCYTKRPWIVEALQEIAKDGKGAGVQTYLNSMIELGIDPGPETIRAVFLRTDAWAKATALKLATAFPHPQLCAPVYVSLTGQPTPLAAAALPGVARQWMLEGPSLRKLRDALPSEGDADLNAFHRLVLKDYSGPTMNWVRPILSDRINQKIEPWLAVEDPQGVATITVRFRGRRRLAHTLLKRRGNRHLIAIPINPDDILWVPGRGRRLSPTMATMAIEATDTVGNTSTLLTTVILGRTGLPLELEPHQERALKQQRQEELKRTPSMAEATPPTMSNIPLPPEDLSLFQRHFASQASNAKSSNPMEREEPRHALRSTSRPSSGALTTPNGKGEVQPQPHSRSISFPRVESLAIDLEKGDVSLSLSAKVPEGMAFTGTWAFYSGKRRLAVQHRPDSLPLASPDHAAFRIQLPLGEEALPLSLPLHGSIEIAQIGDSQTIDLGLLPVAHRGVSIHTLRRSFYDGAAMILADSSHTLSLRLPRGSEITPTQVLSVDLYTSQGERLPCEIGKPSIHKGILRILHLQGQRPWPAALRPVLSLRRLSNRTHASLEDGEIDLTSLLNTSRQASQTKIPPERGKAALHGDLIGIKRNIGSLPSRKQPWQCTFRFTAPPHLDPEFGRFTDATPSAKGNPITLLEPPRGDEAGTASFLYRGSLTELSQATSIQGTIHFRHQEDGRAGRHGIHIDTSRLKAFLSRQKSTNMHNQVTME
jgi:hypothetical protein